MSDTNQQQPDFLPEIRYGRPAVLKVRLISDDELTRLGHGSFESVQKYPPK